jgi:hypothetical protein
MAVFPGQQPVYVLKLDLIGVGTMRVVGPCGAEQDHLLYVLAIQQQAAAWTVRASAFFIFLISRAFRWSCPRVTRFAGTENSTIAVKFRLFFSERYIEPRLLLSLQTHHNQPSPRRGLHLKVPCGPYAVLARFLCMRVSVFDFEHALQGHCAHYS